MPAIPIPPPPWEPKAITPQIGYVGCEDPPVPLEGWQADLVVSIEIDWSCDQVQREGSVSLHECNARVTCVANYNGFTTRGDPVQLLPEPQHALVSGLVLLALLSRWRRR